MPAALWLSALVAVIGAGAILLGATDARLSAASLERAQARHWAEGLAEFAALELAEAAPAYRAALADGVPIHLEHEQGTAEIRLSPESDRLDLNAAEAPEIIALLIDMGLEPGRAERIAGAIADFRDPDDLARLGGAEEAEYAAAGLVHGPLNRPFRHFSELELVLGVDKTLASALWERATIWRERPGLAWVEDIADLGERAETGGETPAGWAATLAGARSDEPEAIGGNAVRIEVAARRAAGALERVTMIILVDSAATPPFRILDQR